VGSGLLLPLPRRGRGGKTKGLLRSSSSKTKTEYKAAGKQNTKKDALKTEGPLKNDIGKQKLKRKGEDPTIPRLPLVISFLLSKVTSCFYVCS
jgi:hypothetical protein